ncbi:MAG: hypothetical protein IPJ68_00105 [Candidatus Moraniibacteriota bacterium]|nr:MAG: hypothetical protein IPJ68_00105 [Candidatus Moranbacteria bacterium]
MHKTQRLASLSVFGIILGLFLLWSHSVSAAGRGVSDGFEGGTTTLGQLVRLLVLTASVMSSRVALDGGYGRRWIQNGAM